MRRRAGDGHVGEHKELLAGIEVLLAVRFGAAGLALLPEMRTVRDRAVLRAVREALRTAASLEAVRAVYQAHLPPPEPQQPDQPGQPDVEAGKAGS